MHFQGITEIARTIRETETGSVDVVQNTLDRIRRLDDSLNSYSHVFDAEALAEAAARDRELAAGTDLGPLHGVPIAVKDLFWVKGTAPNAGGTVFSDTTAEEDATVVERLRAAGAVITGKLKMSEGAFAAHHPSVSRPRNPWDGDAWVGASSSGNAVATAAGLCAASVGTDTGGSIRFPSAATGLTGLKPTWGRVPTHGSVEFAGSLDHIGPMARSVLDCAIVFDAIADRPAPDPEGSNRGQSSLLTACHLGVKPGFRIGIDEGFMAVCDSDTRRVLDSALDTLADLGAKIVAINLPEVDQIVADWTPACAVEAAVVHESAFSGQPDAYGDQLRELIELGIGLTATAFQRILRRRQAFAHSFQSAIREVDAVLLQVTGVAAPDASYLDRIGVGTEWRETIMKATCPVNSAGVPALTLPGGFTDQQRPIGFQLVGACDGEGDLVGIGHAFQQVTTHHLIHPPGFA